MSIGKLEFSASDREKQILFDLINRRVYSLIQDRAIFSLGDASEFSNLSTFSALDSLEGTPKSFTQRVEEVLSQSINQDPLTPESIKSLSNSIAQILLQQFFDGSSKKRIIEVIEDAGFEEIAVDFRKELYFSKNFDTILGILVQDQINQANIDSNQFIFLDANGGKTIFDYGELAEEICKAIKLEFYERFGNRPFDIDSLVHLGIEGFGYDAVQSAKKTAEESNTIIRI